MLITWQLTGQAARWTKTQAIKVPVQYGSSSGSWCPSGNVARSMGPVTGCCGTTAARRSWWVCHVTPIKIMLCRALGVPLSTVYRLYLGSACINEIQWHGRGFAAVHRVNDTSHLP